MVVGDLYTQAELEELAGVPLFEPPYDVPAVQQTVATANQDASRPMRDLLFAALVLALLPRQRGMTYSVQDERYFQDGRGLGNGDMQSRVFAEAQYNATRLERLMADVVSGGLPLGRFQEIAAGDLLRAHLRMAQGGAGTAGRLTPAHLQALRDRVVGSLDSLNRLGGAMARGEISDKMALWQARRLGQGTAASFWEGRHVSHSGDRWLARRDLDPASEHCPDCVGHSTGGRWLPAEDVVPVGVACVCKGFCRCQVEYRIVSLSDRLPLG